MDTKGYVKFSRATLDSDIFRYKPASWFKMWFYIIAQVNHKQYKHIKRGEGLFKYSEIARSCAVTVRVVDGFMRWCREVDMLTTRRTTRGVLINVVNYSKYQDSGCSTDDTPDDSVERTEVERRWNGGGTEVERIRYDKQERKNERTKERNNTTAPCAFVDEDVDEDEDKKPKERSDIEKVIDVFYNTVNPDILFGSKTNRSGAEWLVKKFGVDGAVRMAQRVCSEQMPGKITPYTPTCTTPYQLQTRLAQWKIYFRKQEAKEKEEEDNKYNPEVV